MKLCQIYNLASHYRAPIFRLISKTFDTDFVFGESKTDIKKFDYGLLHGNVKEVPCVSWKGFNYYKGVLNLLCKPYDTYILTGETRCLSTWLFLVFSFFFPHKRFYLWTHGWYGKESRLERFLKKILFRMPTGIFLYGNYAKQLMINEGFKAEKLHVIHNSLDYDVHVKLRKNLAASSIYKSHFKNENPNLIFVGRLTAVKKLEMILEALRLNKQNGESYNLTFIGAGERAEFLKDLTKKFGLEDNVWFYGACYDESLLGELIYNADLCVSPGNVGLTAIHSLVFGTPVLTHNNFAYQMPEFEAVREGETGSFFNDGDVKSLAEKINLWFKNTTNREDVRQICMKEIDTSWTPYYQLEILRTVLKRK